MDHDDGWTAARTPSRSGETGSGEAGAATITIGRGELRPKGGPSSLALGLAVVQTHHEPCQFSAQRGKGRLRRHRLSEDHQAFGGRCWKMSADVAQAPPELVAKDGGSEGFPQDEDRPGGGRPTAANPEKGALRPRHRTRRPVAARFRRPDACGPASDDAPEWTVRRVCAYAFESRACSCAADGLADMFASRVTGPGKCRGWLRFMTVKLD